MPDGGAIVIIAIPNPQVVAYARKSVVIIGKSMFPTQERTYGVAIAIGLFAVTPPSTAMPSVQRKKENALATQTMNAKSTVTVEPAGIAVPPPAGTSAGIARATRTPAAAEEAEEAGAVM